MRLLNTHKLIVWRYSELDPASVKGRWNDVGEWEEAVKVPFVFGGTLYPYNEGHSMKLSADMITTKDCVFILSHHALYTYDEIRQREADIVTIDGLAYEVIAVQDWTVLRNTRHYRAIAQRRDDLDGEHCESQ